MYTAKDLEEPAHQEFDTGFTKDQPVDETTQHHDFFQKPTKPPTPDRDWNKTLPAAYGPIQPWISSLARKEDTRDSFNELMDTPLDFSAFVMNRLKVDTLTPELLAEVYKETTDQLDWNNPEGQQYPHDLCKPLPLIPNSQGRRVIPFDQFINNDLEYLRGGTQDITYATSSNEGQGADYGPVNRLKKMVRKRQQFYGFAVNRESARDVYSRNRIIVVTKLQIVEWHNYKHLDWITVRRNDDKLYTFKEGDYKRLRLQDIKDMLLLVQGKLTNLTIEERLALNVSLRMFTRSIVIQRRVEDLYDGILNNVQTALDDILKRIGMKYLPQTGKRFDTSAGNLIKEILLKLNLPDHSSIHMDSKEYLKMVMERQSVKVKEIQERCIIKSFSKLSNQEMYEHVGPEVTSSRDGKVYKMVK
ncbi:hypothetical protein Tco_1155139 [Tanacetum coccineum]